MDCGDRRKLSSAYILKACLPKSHNWQLALSSGTPEVDILISATNQNKLFKRLIRLLRGQQFEVPRLSELNNPSARARSDTRPILSWVWLVLIQSFPFHRFVVIPNLKKPSLRWYLPILRKSSSHTFLKSISVWWNAKSVALDLNSGHRIHFHLR